MQAIVADTTPLNYLVLIQAAEILPNLYRTVLIPPAVKAELAHANAPAIVRAWISQLTDSLTCKPCSNGYAPPRSGHRFASW
jgi:predicted nucleic acid-binding protein